LLKPFREYAAKRPVSALAQPSAGTPRSSSTQRGYAALKLNPARVRRAQVNPARDYRVQHKRSDTMAMRPLHDRVLVQRVKEEEKTKGGIIIPDSAKEKPIEGKVVAVGNGKILEDGSVRKLEVKKGDRVLFGKYSGTEVKIDGEEHLILREDDILGIVE
jgi:chaperonin GroES